MRSKSPSTDRQIALGVCVVAAIGLWLLQVNQETQNAMRRRALDHPGEAIDEDRGRNADVPEEIPSKGLYDVAWRVVHEILKDRVAFVAAGVTFYVLLALFPALGAIVALYGLLIDPVDIADHLRTLAYVLPPGAFDILATQLLTLVHMRDATLSLTFFIGLTIALWSARNGALALFDAMNVAYQEVEKRGYFRLNLVAIVFTLCAIVAIVLMIGIAAALPTVLRVTSFDPTNETMILLTGRSLVVIAALIGSAVIYRVGPSRQPAKFRWLTWGSVFTTATWVAMSLGYAWYLDNLANYAASYGALGGLVGFLIWLWLSVALLIVGAEINAELEHQTARDSTTGTPLPIGSRGAHMADTIGKAAK